jgi:hypothetical protein
MLDAIVVAALVSCGQQAAVAGALGAAAGGRRRGHQGIRYALRPANSGLSFSFAPDFANHPGPTTHRRPTRPPHACLLCYNMN